ncbi:MAG: dihydrofolate reductase family protein [Dehalococcoidia bacterium]
MAELLVDFITSLDGYASGEGWPGWWGLQGPEYLAWLNEQPERNYTLVMGATTYRQMYGFASAPQEEFGEEERKSIADLAKTPKIVFSSSLQGPLPWENTQLVSGDAVEKVKELKRNGTNMSTIGSLSLSRSLIEAGVVDRFRVVMFPVITGKTGSERIYDGYPDVALKMISSRTFDGSIQMVEYVPTVLEKAPLAP